MIVSIEAPFALLQKPVQVIGFDAIELTHMAFGLVPEILNAIDVVFFISKESGVVDSHVVKIAYIKGIVGSECIRINDAVRFNLLLDDWQERFGFDIRDYGRVYLAAPLQ